MNVPQRRAIVSIQRDVERLVAESGVQEGLVLVNAMHIVQHLDFLRTSRAIALCCVAAIVPV